MMDTCGGGGEEQGPPGNGCGGGAGDRAAAGSDRERPHCATRDLVGWRLLLALSSLFFRGCSAAVGYLARTAGGRSVAG
jgi:hypothetical protein